jgi:hypothetical protein
MSSNPSMRASDRDRDRTADVLREHHALGRLDATEFAERLDKSFNAKTVDELDELTADLPAIDPYPLPAAALPRNRTVRSDLPASYIFSATDTANVRIWHGSGRLAPGWLAAWASWAAITLICFISSVLSGSPWPLLAAGAIGVVMGARWVAGPRALGRGLGRRGQIGSSGVDEITGGGDK